MATVPSEITAAFNKMPALAPQLSIVQGGGQNMAALIAAVMAHAPVFGFPADLPQAEVDALIPEAKANAQAMKDAIGDFQAIKDALDQLAAVEPLLDAVIALP